jgi:hypothetical protein
MSNDPLDIAIAYLQTFRNGGKSNSFFRIRRHGHYWDAGNVSDDDLLHFIYFG